MPPTTATQSEWLLNRVPNLVYIGDVPIESSYHGSALLYRLLQNYPCERLLIIEGTICISQPARRLSGVRYAKLRVGNGQLLHTRLASWYSSWLTLIAVHRVRQTGKLLMGFRPSAVLTVTHGYSWITAAKFAATHGLPLHLICHDDWPRMTNIRGALKGRLETTFSGIYREAASRLCVSPAMCETYRNRYGSTGTLLYPSRAPECPDFQAPPQRLACKDHVFTAVFAGTINSQGYVSALKAVATALEEVGGQLLIFGPLTAEIARQTGLARPNIMLRGVVTSDKLMTLLREEADVLFVPMSFDAADRANMEISFPSKLTDYTAVGVPLLIYGPFYSSAVRWAGDNPGVAEVVDEENLKNLTDAVLRLSQSPAHRLATGMKALYVGRRYFTWAAAQDVFQQALVSPDAIQ